MSSNNVVKITPIGCGGGGGGGGGGSSGLATVNYSNSTISSITLTSAGTGYGYTSAISYSATATNPVMTITGTGVGGDAQDVVIQLKDGKKIRVGKSISLLLEHLMLIVPDDRELEDNPALKLAYENYLEVLKSQMDPKLVEAYESYHMVRKLSKDDE